LTSAVDKLANDAARLPQPIRRLLKTVANDGTAVFTLGERGLRYRCEFDTGLNALSLNKLRGLRCPSGT
jgi:type VI protein secretion system component VasK